jgi:PRTRC genetic system protein F
MQPEDYDGNLLAAIEKALHRFPGPSTNAPDLVISFKNNWFESMDIEPGDMPVPEDTGAILIARDTHTQYAIGKGVEMLEQACAGLGQTVLHTLYDAGRRTIGLVDPPRIWQMIDWQQWSGMGNSKQARQEALEAGGEPESILTEEDIYKQYPKWSFTPEPIHGFDTIKLPVWLQKARLKLTEVFRVEDVIKATRELRRMLTCARIENEIDRVPMRSELSGPFWIMWKEGDLATDIVDYQYQYECESGETIGDLCYIKFLQWGDVDATRDALREICSIGAIVKKMEELILLLGEQL